MKRWRRRAGVVRQSRGTILILCEGRSTESIYFNAIKAKLRASHIDVISDRKQGLTASAMIEELEHRRKLRLLPDEVFCVFDLDVHASTYKGIIEALEGFRHSKVRVVPSRPCFEYWLLTYFERTNAPYVGSPGGKSACDQVIARLRKHVGGYRKANAEMLRALVNDDKMLAQALANWDQCPQDFDQNPCTKVGALVRYLLGLAPFEADNN